MIREHKTVTLEIEGMTCAGCAAHVGDRLASVAGVSNVDVSHAQATAAVTTIATLDPADLVRSLVGTGYAAREASSTPVMDLDARSTHGDDDRKHLVVIGGGSAGFAAAIRAVERGARVTLVNTGPLGGTCVNVGCVPSKTLIRAAEARHRQASHSFEGIGRAQASVDWSAVRAGKDDLVLALRGAKYEDVLRAHPEIEFIEGRARFDSEGRVSVDGFLFAAATGVVIATGSSPWIPEIPGLGEAGYLDSTGLLDIDELPETLAVVGGGAVGLELAQAYARLGVEVTVLARSSLLSGADPDVGAELARHLRDEGLDVRVGVTVASVARAGMRRVLRLEQDGTAIEAVTVDQIVVATGRRANTAGMGLEGAGIRTGAFGEITVGANLATAVPGVFAAGDVTGGPMHVYVAALAGQVAADNALGGDASMDWSAMPEVVFTDPGVALVGLDERRAMEAGYDPIVSMLPMEHVPRALAARDTRGFVKLVADASSRRVLGASIVAPEAGEMIMEPTLALRFGLTVEDLTSTMHPYLTLGEGVKLAALAFDKDVAKLSCCAA